MNIDHAAINVLDLEAMKEFFVNYFGGQPSADYHNPRTGLRSCFITFPDGGTRLELMNWPAMREPQHAADAPRTAGYCHIAMSVGSREAVDTLTARLLADGYRHLSGPRTTGDGCYESCILLPDGEELEITI